jgi:prepilin-type N-terminal cleavage/methylation domain-containing protein
MNMAGSAVMIARRSYRGFTLIELVTAVAIVGLMVGVGAPFFAKTIAQRRLSGTAERIATDLRSVQTQAVSQNGTYRLHSGADPAEGKAGQYRLERNVGGATWTPVGAWYSLSQDYLGGTLAGITDSATSPTTLYEVRFGPQGSVTNSGALTYPIVLTVTTPAGTRSIKVMRTGAVRIP